MPHVRRVADDPGDPMRQPALFALGDLLEDQGRPLGREDRLHLRAAVDAHGLPGRCLRTVVDAVAHAVSVHVGAIVAGVAYAVAVGILLAGVARMVCSASDGKRKSEFSAPSREVFDPDPSAMAFDCQPAEGQAKAQAFDPLIWMDAREFIKDPVNIVWVHPGSGIKHPEVDLILDHLSANLYLAFRGGVFDCVLNQVDQYPFDHISIRSNRGDLLFDREGHNLLF